jgi:hypothetical protein
MDEKKRKNMIAVSILAVVALSLYFGSFIFLTK